MKLLLGLIVTFTLSPINLLASQNDIQPVTASRPDNTSHDVQRTSAQEVHWSEALKPYIPARPKSARIIPNTQINPVLLKSDGSPACNYLKCQRSIIALSDWSDFGFNYDTGCAIYPAMGGHADLGANSVYQFCVGNLTWKRLYDYSAVAAPFPNLVDSDGNGRPECAPLLEGPFGAHSYDGVEYVAATQLTIMLRTIGYQPKWQNCENVGIMKKPNVWAWHDDGHWVDLGIEFLRFPRAAYDSERDKLYYVAQKPDGIYELDPLSLKSKKIAGIWAGKGGVMAMRGRDLFITSQKGGLYTVHISRKGNAGHVSKLVDYSDWDNKGWGMDVSGDVVVGWNGDNQFFHYDISNGKKEFVRASGDSLPDNGGAGRVYGKFIAVPNMPGIFIGNAENYGWVIYKAL